MLNDQKPSSFCEIKENIHYVNYQKIKNCNDFICKVISSNLSNYAKINNFILIKEAIEFNFPFLFSFTAFHSHI